MAKSSGCNHWHHFVSQKDIGWWGGSWRAFGEGGDAQHHAHPLFIPRDWLHGTERDGKAGPMQFVSQDLMVRADNVWWSPPCSCTSQAADCWFCLKECLQITGISLNSCALWTWMGEKIYLTVYTCAPPSVPVMLISGLVFLPWIPWCPQWRIFSCSLHLHPHPRGVHQMQRMLHVLSWLTPSTVQPCPQLAPGEQIIFIEI